VLLEVFTDAGVGTLVRPGHERGDYRKV